MKKILPWVFAVGSTTTNLNAQINNTQMGDWDITSMIIELFGTEIENGPGKKSQYNQSIYTKQVVCKTDTVTINAIIGEYGEHNKRPGIQIEASPNALDNFGRKKRDGNSDRKKVLSEILQLEQEEQEDKEIYYYCPKPS